jgi:hypothetical protein
VNGSTGKPDPVAAYREMESITISILAACEREQLDAILAELGRREEVQAKIEQLGEEDIAPVRAEVLALLGRIRALDEEIEPKMYMMMDTVRAKIRSVANSRKLLEHYLKEPDSSDAKFLDRRG